MEYELPISPQGAATLPLRTRITQQGDVTAAAAPHTREEGNVPSADHLNGVTRKQGVVEGATPQQPPPQRGGAAPHQDRAPDQPHELDDHHEQRHRGPAVAAFTPMWNGAHGNSLHALGHYTSPHSNPLLALPAAPRQARSPTAASAPAPMPWMPTRVVTLQPCKIVYHYPDHTVHTYVLVHGESAAGGDGALHSPVSSPLPQLQPAGGMRADAQQNQVGPCLASPQFCTPSLFTCGGDENRRSGVRLGHAASTKPHPHEGTHAASKAASGDTSNAATAASALHMAPMCPTCGTSACLPDAYRPPEYVADITPSNPRIGSPGPVTLFAFGFTTCLYNVHQAGICPMNLTTMGLICFYGGLSQFVGGFFELMNKNTIFCTLDVTYGAFWMATAITNLVPPNANVVAEATSDYMGGFFMLWFFFAATMFASSMKFSYVQMLLNFSVMLNFFLNFLGSFIQSKTLLHVAGYEGIVEGCLATYVGMAFTMRDIYGRNILPLFFQKNFRVTEW